MKKYILVYNPVSGDAGFKQKLDYVIQRFQEKQNIVVPFRASHKSCSGDFISWAKELGADGIIVSGGDGTVHEVVNLVLASDINLPVGIIPSGTCNDFATHLNLSGDLDKCIDVILAGNAKKVDIGMINGDKYFLNVASAGLLTSVAHNVDTALKNTLGKIAYYLRGLGELPNFRTIKAKFDVDGKIIEDEIFLFLVVNSGTAAGFPNVAPAAKIDDGKLDLLILNKCNVPELMRVFIGLLTGTHINHKNVTYLQAKNIYVECTEEVESDMDGELGPKLPLSITTVADKLRIFL